MTMPFLKWAGGKRWIMKRNLPIPKDFNTYYEPFLGSGAVFFKLEPKSAVLSDINQDLIELYQTIAAQPDDFQRLLSVHHNNHCKEYYYQIRDTIPSSHLERAARFLYLNRTCWNGLYRVNLNGKFNVPIGTKTCVIMESDDFKSISALLRTADLFSCDFEETIEKTQENDFLFVDPPYTVLHNNNNFLKYNENIFSWADQVRLSKSLLRAKARGVKILVTNADHPLIRRQYNPLGKYRQVTRQSVLAGTSARRGATTEAIFTANIETS